MTRGRPPAGTAYYNEWEPYPAAWLRNLIAAGELTDGLVDERSIVEVHPDELRGYTRVHLFAGIGGWDYALRLAGWGDVPVWTASCPCQPFSVAGKAQTVGDERHLWPVVRRLVGELRPPVLVGEQVASAAGRAWLAGVRADLEGLGYAVGAADLCAAGIGAPHLRQRLYWVAESCGAGVGRAGEAVAGSNGAHDGVPGADGGGGSEWLADASNGDGRRGERRTEAGARAHRERRQRSSGDGPAGRVDNATGARQQPEEPRPEGQARDEAWLRGLERGRPDGGLGDADGSGPQGRNVRFDEQSHPQGWEATERQARLSGSDGFWDASEFLPCLDGKARRTQPGLFPLAHGVPARVGRLRAYGNAIVPPLAAAFLRAYLELG